MHTLVLSMLLPSAVALFGHCNYNQRVNAYAFSVLTADGKIYAWGQTQYGGDAASGSGYTAIVSSDSNFAALNAARTDR